MELLERLWPMIRANKHMSVQALSPLSCEIGDRAAFYQRAKGLFGRFRIVPISISNLRPGEH